MWSRREEEECEICFVESISRTNDEFLRAFHYQITQFDDAREVGRSETRMRIESESRFESTYNVQMTFHLMLLDWNPNDAWDSSFQLIMKGAHVDLPCDVLWQHTRHTVNVSFSRDHFSPSWLSSVCCDRMWYMSRAGGSSCESRRHV